MDSTSVTGKSTGSYAPITEGAHLDAHDETDRDAPVEIAERRCSTLVIGVFVGIVFVVLIAVLVGLLVASQSSTTTTTATEPETNGIGTMSLDVDHYGHQAAYAWRDAETPLRFDSLFRYDSARKHDPAVLPLLEQVSRDEPMRFLHQPNSVDIYELVGTLTVDGPTNELRLYLDTNLPPFSSVFATQVAMDARGRHMVARATVRICKDEACQTRDDEASSSFFEQETKYAITGAVESSLLAQWSESAADLYLNFFSKDEKGLFGDGGTTGTLAIEHLLCVVRARVVPRLVDSPESA